MVAKKQGREAQSLQISISHQALKETQLELVRSRLRPIQLLKLKKRGYPLRMQYTGSEDSVHHSIPAVLDLSACIILIVLEFSQPNQTLISYMYDLLEHKSAKSHRG